MFFFAVRVSAMFEAQDIDAARREDTRAMLRHPRVLLPRDVAKPKPYAYGACAMPDVDAAQF